MSDEEAAGVEDERIKQLIKDTRAQAEQNANDRAAIAAERLEVGFERANIPAAGPGLLFRENYKGDPSADAIKSAAEKYGILSPQQQQADTSQEEELQRLRTSQQSVGDQAHTPNVADEIRAKMLKVDESNLSPDEKSAAIMEIVRQHNLTMDTSESGSSRFLAGQAPIIR